ncbi:MAG: heterodisulfide reductase-related iron-sulfur binding cluster [Rhodospirillaceae bacterium]
MREGSLEAPTRHPVDWQSPDYYDEAKLETELRRVFGHCHDCRRCFRLCASFPRLFDLIDATPGGTLDAVPAAALKSVVDACTLCDLCALAKCPYLPPHPFDIDVPHLMLRYRAVMFRQGRVPPAARALSRTDRNGRLAGLAAPLANWATDRRNELTRPGLERLARIHRDAAVPSFHGRTFMMRAQAQPVYAEVGAPGYGRKAALYATCFTNYNNPEIGMAARAVLARNGVDVREAYPGCCAMPHLEQGDLEAVAASAGRVARGLEPLIDEGYAIVALVPSCALMLKNEWPLLVPRSSPDFPRIEKLAAATFDISEYLVEIARTVGLAPGLAALPGGVTLHIACHARAQAIGRKSADLLREIPGLELTVIERCSGHGGSWGLHKDNFELALEIGAPVAREVARSAHSVVASECPLAGRHILQGLERIEGTSVPSESLHPVQVLALAYGLA